MLSSYIIAVLISIFLSVGTYFALQKTLITVHLEIFIDAAPLDVYNILSKPALLTDIHYLVRDVNITWHSEDDGSGTEKWEYLVTEDMVHIGEHKFPCWSKAEKSKMKININSAPFFGIVYVDLVYTMQPATKADMEGTLLTEKLSLYVPWIIQGYSNKTAVNTHHELLKNTKLLLEENITLGSEA